MKNTLITNLISKIKGDMVANGSGSFKMGKMAFKVKTETFTISGLHLTWNFRDVNFNLEGLKMTGSGNSEFKMVIDHLEIVSKKKGDSGSFVMESIEIDSIDELVSMAGYLPIEEIKALADWRDNAVKEKPADKAE